MDENGGKFESQESTRTLIHTIHKKYLSKYANREASETNESALLEIIAT